MSENNHDFTRWADETAQNASSLADEAQILLDHKKYERAYYLSHMANEESTKAILLRALPFLGVPLTEHKKINNLLRSHPQKISLLLNNAKALAGDKETKESQEFIREITDYQEYITKHINNKKNDTMYVSMVEGEIITPRETIEGIDVEKHVLLARKLALWASSQRFETQANSNGDNSETR